MEGAYKSQKKDGTIYYRSSITHNGIHISLGSFPNEIDATIAYKEARRIYQDTNITTMNFRDYVKKLHWEKAICILNHRDHGIYVKTPIYQGKEFVSYFLSPNTILKFDTDDFFYYSQHKILSRNGGSYYVNDYGSQYRILSRYGIRNYAVEGRDYDFVNGDPHDMRRANIQVYSHYHGVVCLVDSIPMAYEARIHLNGDYRIGCFESEEEAAVAYNKAVDYAKDHGIHKNFPMDFVEELTPREYAYIYRQVKLPKRYRNGVKEMATSPNSLTK